MADHKVWSLSLGRWGHVPVRVHMFFLLFAAFTLYLGRKGIAGDSWLAALSIIILLASVLLHELGHYLVANRLGGGTSQIVLGPLGGLTPVHVPFDPRSELIAVLAGPVVNLVICLVCFSGCLYVAQREDATLTMADWLNPLQPAIGEFEGFTPIVGLELTRWINWVLFLVNMIPAFPFDGSRALMALVALTPNAKAKRQSVRLVATMAKFVAIGLLVTAWFVRNQNVEPVPPWFALVVLAIFLYFSARVEESQKDAEQSDDELFGYDFSQGYTSLEGPEEQGPTRRGPFMQWLERRREQRRRHQRAVEVEEDQRVDEILARLHERGMESLSSEERALLNRVSARYRSRESR